MAIYQILKDQILRCMIESGRLPEGSKIEIIGVTGENSSNYRRVEINATLPRKKKPSVYWNLCIDIARELIRWDTSTFYKL